MDGGAWWATIHGVTKSQKMTEWLHFHFDHTEDPNWVWFTPVSLALGSVPESFFSLNGWWMAREKGDEWMDNGQVDG